MKFLVALSIGALSLGAFAADLSTMKSEANTNLDSKITGLQTARTCINNAKTVEGFKACKYDMHEGMKMQKMEEMKSKEDIKAAPTDIDL